jgi:hypothetical protein
MMQTIIIIRPDSLYRLRISYVLEGAINNGDQSMARICRSLLKETNIHKDRTGRLDFVLDFYNEICELN